MWEENIFNHIYPIPLWIGVTDSIILKLWVKDVSRIFSKEDESIIESKIQRSTRVVKQTCTFLSQGSFNWIIEAHRSVFRETSFCVKPVLIQSIINLERKVDGWMKRNPFDGRYIIHQNIISLQVFFYQVLYNSTLV